MNRAKALKIVNVLLLLLFVSQAVTGLGRRYFAEELFEKLHVSGGKLLVVLVLIHFFLNWSWIKSTYLSGNK